MKCRCKKQNCGCKFNLSCHGAYDPCKIVLNGMDNTQLNWNEISVPEIMTIPEQKPDIEHLDHVYVTVDLDCLNLIETPFAYKVYETAASSIIIAAVEVLVTPLEPLIAAIENVITLAGDVLDVPGLPAIPAVVAYQVALAAVEAALLGFTDALTAITDLLADLAAGIINCIVASVLQALLIALETAMTVLLAALNALIAAGNALVAATAGDLVVGPLVAAAVALVNGAIDLITPVLETALTAITSLLDIFGVTQYFAIEPNAEGTCLSGRKIIVEGCLKQKVVYTGLVDEQSVHSAHCKIPFTAYIVPYAKFVGLELVENVTVLADPTTCETIVIDAFPFDPNTEIIVDLCEEFCVNAYIEDIFAYTIDPRTIFKNITVFLKATPAAICD